MAKYLVIALIVALCLNMVLSNPIPEQEEYQVADEIVRQKRVTCDLLSFEAKGVAVNHAACAAHCLVLGKRGGSCNGGVCVCRN